MRYFIKLKVIPPRAELEPDVARLVERLGLTWKRIGNSSVIEIPLEKDDSRLEELQQGLRHFGTSGIVFYEPVFEKWEVERARLLNLVVESVCGPGFVELAKELGLPHGSRIVDAREMGNQEIALTYAFEIVISDAWRDFLMSESLTGIGTMPIDDARSGRPSGLFQLVATNELPPLAVETDVHFERHTKPSDPLFGTTGLFLRAPISYLESELGRVLDFNFTHEEFGEEPQKQPLMIISQRAWKVFRSRRIRNVTVEPVVVMENRTGGKRVDS